jgi:hypothetical protein
VDCEREVVGHLFVEIFLEIHVSRSKFLSSRDFFHEEADAIYRGVRHQYPYHFSIEDFDNSVNLGNRQCILALLESLIFDRIVLPTGFGDKMEIVSVEEGSSVSLSNDLSLRRKVV